MDNLSARMQLLLPAELVDFLQIAGGEAGAMGTSLYLVGGAVRDLLLERPNTDFDLVLEGDAIGFARQLAKASGERVTIHTRFGTAKFGRGDINIDVVTARSESYSKPGALPTVKPGTIAEDLARRDFSVNAMAINLTPGSFGNLFDPHNGLEDLNRGLIRILHDRSFVDDATRIMRALRYEHRLGFRLEEATERLVRNHTLYIDTISGDRLRHELELILSEEMPEKILERAHELGVLQKIHPALAYSDWMEDSFREARERETPDAELYLSLLAYPLEEEDIDRLASRLSITGELKRSMKQLPSLKASQSLLAAPNTVPSTVYRMLENFNPRAIAACAVAADDPMVRFQLERYLNELRFVQTFLNGDALKEMGVEPGRHLGKILEAIREAKLDGIVNTMEEEEALVRRLLKEGGDER